MDRNRLADMLQDESASIEARRFRIVSCLVLAAAVLAVALLTVAAIAARYEALLAAIVIAGLCFFIAEWLARLLLAPAMSPAQDTRAARRAYALSPLGLVDAVAALSLPLALALGLTVKAASFFVVLWLFKLARSLPGLTLLARVWRNERKTLVSVFVVFALVLVTAAEVEYLVESAAQPATFGSLPAALWWSIVTLTTTGYGDAVPTTVPGRLVAGAVMICGIGVFALMAGILASGFAAEVRRRDFLANWNLVARVPFLHSLGAGTIAEVARLLRPKEVPAGAVVMRRGQPGDCMYFIVAGEVEVQVQPQPIRLGAGDFLGEIALITGGPRMATVVATTRTALLTLDIADFRDLAGRHPELARAIEQEGARRLASQNPAGDASALAG